MKLFEVSSKKEKSNGTRVFPYQVDGDKYNRCFYKTLNITSRTTTKQHIDSLTKTGYRVYTRILNHKRIYSVNSRCYVIESNVLSCRRASCCFFGDFKTYKKAKDRVNGLIFKNWKGDLKKWNKFKRLRK